MSEGNIPEVNKTSDVEEAPKALNKNVESPEVQEVAAEAVDAAFIIFNELTESERRYIMPFTSPQTGEEKEGKLAYAKKQLEIGLMIKSHLRPIPASVS